MNQPPHVAGHEAVGVKIILLQLERRILLLQVTRAISLHAMPQDQILRPRRRTNRIGLHEAQAVDRCLERCWREQGLRDGMGAEATKILRTTHSVILSVLAKDLHSKGIT